MIPLPMANAFEALRPEVRRLLEEDGLAEATPAQEAAIPRILEGRSVLLLAPTGAGKTEAAMLPVLHFLLERERRGIGCLYVTPLRALNRDIHRRVASWAQRLGLRVEVRHGDTPQGQRRAQAARPPDLLVTTPETLQAILPARRMRAHLAAARHVVVDEVHQLAKDRRGVQLAAGLERLREVAGDFQRVGLSATVGEPAQVAALFGGPEPLEVVEVAPPKRMEFHVEWPKPTDEDFALARELFISPEVASSLTLIRDVVEGERASLVFVNSRLNAELLSSRLPLVMEGVAVHHGSLPRRVREEAENDLKAGKLKALVCTSTLELGVDVGRVDRALLYQSPRQATALVQRVGRAGHSLARVSRGTVIVGSVDDLLESVAVIRRAERGALERFPVHEGALDVLGHQLVGLALDHGGRVVLERAAEALRRAWPYRALGPQAERVAAYLAHLGLVRREGGALAATAKGRAYYFRNLSTIRDERTYPVVDVSTMEPVGILGEEEVVLRARRGVGIVVRGRTWRIVQVAPDGTVFVEPVADPTARIPGWDGEILPVPFQVAQEAARLRAEAAEALRAGPVEQALEALAARWPASRAALRRAVESIAEHLGSGAPLPTHENLVVEAFDHYLCFHAPFGEVVNETFGDVLEELLARRGLVRFWWHDAYRVLLDLTGDARGPWLEGLAAQLRSLGEKEVEELLGVFLRDHLPIGFFMKGVAERLGAIPRGLFVPADELNSFEVRFQGTPVEEEALREALLEHADLERVRGIFRALRQGALRLEVHRGEGPSPLAYPIVRRYVEAPELLSPEADRERAVERMEQSLRTERVNLLCFACARIHEGLVVGEMPERLACEDCGGLVLGVLAWHGQPVREALLRHKAGEPLSEEEAKELARTRQGADLVAVHGRRAVVALSVYGVGPQAAARILARMHRDERAFHRDLYEAKLRYVLTRPYWDRPGHEPAGKPYAYSPREGRSTERRL